MLGLQLIHFNKSDILAIWVMLVGAHFSKRGPNQHYLNGQKYYDTLRGNPSGAENQIFH